MLIDNFGQELIGRSQRSQDGCRFVTDRMAKGPAVVGPLRDQLSVLSYNLWQGRAQRELPALVAAQDPDVLCVQEAHGTALPKSLGGLRLARTTARNRLAVALYVREARFDVQTSAAVRLSVSRHDRLVGGTDERLVAARVLDRGTGRGLVLGSFHATPFTDSNGFRRRQVDDGHHALRDLGPGLPTMMAGDFNHPILLGMLRRHLNRRGFTVALQYASLA